MIRCVFSQCCHTQDTYLYFTERSACSRINAVEKKDFKVKCWGTRLIQNIS